MRTTLIAAALIVTAGLAACSKEDATQVKEGAQAVGSELKEAATNIKNDPDVKEAGAAIKDAAKDAGEELKATANQAGDAAKDAGADIEQGAKEVGADARQAGKKAGDDIKRATN